MFFQRTFIAVFKIKNLNVALTCEEPKAAFPLNLALHLTHVPFFREASVQVMDTYLFAGWKAEGSKKPTPNAALRTPKNWPFGLMTTRSGRCSGWDAIPCSSPS